MHSLDSRIAYAISQAPLLTPENDVTHVDIPIGYVPPHPEKLITGEIPILEPYAIAVGDRTEFNRAALVALDRLGVRDRAGWAYSQACHEEAHAKAAKAQHFKVERRMAFYLHGDDPERIGIRPYVALAGTAPAIGHAAIAAMPAEMSPGDRRKLPVYGPADPQELRHAIIKHNTASNGPPIPLPPARLERSLKTMALQTGEVILNDIGVVFYNLRGGH